MSLVTKATTLKARMMKVVEHLGDHEVAGPRVAAIRAGNGYLDLANDIIALANLYTTYRANLAGDTKDYDANDAPLHARSATRSSTS